jgi:hypothetical protein
LSLAVKVAPTAKGLGMGALLLVLLGMGTMFEGIVGEEGGERK